MKIWAFLVTFSILRGAVIKKPPMKKPAKAKSTIAKPKKSAKTAKTVEWDLRKDVSNFKTNFLRDKIETCAVTGTKYCLEVDHVVEVQQAKFCLTKLANNSALKKIANFSKKLNALGAVIRDEWLNGK